MTVYRMPSNRPYQRRFRIFSWSAIAFLLAIALFSVFEPQSVSRRTNIALALVMGAVAIAVLIYGLFLSPKESLWKLQSSYQWELTEDKIIQSQSDGVTVEIPLDGIRALREAQGWLLVVARDSPKGIMIPCDIAGYAEVRRQLIARCPLTPTPKRGLIRAFWPVVVSAILFTLVIFSHNRSVVIASGVAVLLIWPLYIGQSLRELWRAELLRKRVLFSYLLTCLILIWVVYKAMRAVI
jgi:hypothetical protein